MTAQGTEPEPAAGTGQQAREDGEAARAGTPLQAPGPAASGSGDADSDPGPRSSAEGEQSPWARPAGAAGSPATPATSVAPATSVPPSRPAVSTDASWRRPATADGGSTGGLPSGPSAVTPPAPQLPQPLRPPQASWGTPQVDNAAAWGSDQGARSGGEGGAGHGTGAAPAGQQTHCYRHPQKEAYVACQRCGRPICPDCMRPAAVGFHCPEEGGAQRQSAPRTTFGGRDQASPGLVTKILIGVCFVAFLLQGVPGLTGAREINQFTFDFSLIGFKIAVDDQYYRLVTAAFLHGSILHIVLNMYALYLLGTQLEAVLGRARYLALFFTCAIGGNTLSYLMSGQDKLSYGASTAIFGFFAAYYLIARRLRLNTNQILIVVGINLAITFTFSGIDKWGHIGGLGVGLLLGLLYTYVPPRRAALQALGTAIVLAALLAAAVLQSQSLTSGTL